MSWKSKFNSTREFWREGRQIGGYSFFDWLHGYVYGRWPYTYIGIGVGEHPAVPYLMALARLFAAPYRWIRATSSNGGQDASTNQTKINVANTYHGKVVPLEAARQLVTVNEPIRLPDLEQVIPYTRARALIMRNPDHIAVLECPCRSARENPCLPLEVCLIIGEPFVSFVLDHHPQKARRISQQEAGEILAAEDDRGHVHHAFFKDAMLDRFYAICNCCACCCGAMNAHHSGIPMLASSGYVCQVEEELCIGCESCVEFCQFAALSLVDFTAWVDYEACMGCGVCVQHCPEGALVLERVPAKGVPLELCALTGLESAVPEPHLLRSG